MTTIISPWSFACYFSAPVLCPSRVTPKAANEGHLKTGQRKGPGT
jgi:hypothetical protein